MCLINMKCLCLQMALPRLVCGCTLFNWLKRNHTHIWILRKLQNLPTSWWMTVLSIIIILLTLDTFQLLVSVLFVVSGCLHVLDPRDITGEGQTKIVKSCGVYRGGVYDQATQNGHSFALWTPSVRPVTALLTPYSHDWPSYTCAPTQASDCSDI